MFEKIRKMKNKKGFTLVELIVVLVILAILAALLVPALTGYIDKARKQSIIAETRQCVMAAQTIASEKYGATEGNVANTDIDVTKVTGLAEVKGEVSGITIGKAGDSKYNGKVMTLTYTKKNGSTTYTCTYNAEPTNGEQYSVS